ncbi:hypothetical protein TSAR_000297 [Trichomalopsis sarcophagae]|uniref:Uncharacterized protein n=1 Tax=Trichomalopsis sarcophagae TaxID=543379 RepID=A0A232FEU0_9HYME|nr:hypothetical protein TSAR_000297 [Trichomalopsis sarcophagae]
MVDLSEGTGDMGGLKPRDMLLWELLTAESLSESSRDEVEAVVAAGRAADALETLGRVGGWTDQLVAGGVRGFGAVDQGGRSLATIVVVVVVVVVGLAVAAVDREALALEGRGVVGEDLGRGHFEGAASSDGRAHGAGVARQGALGAPLVLDVGSRSLIKIYSVDFDIKRATMANSYLVVQNGIPRLDLRQVDDGLIDGQGVLLRDDQSSELGYSLPPLLDQLVQAALPDLVAGSLEGRHQRVGPRDDGHRAIAILVVVGQQFAGRLESVVPVGCSRRAREARGPGQSVGLSLARRCRQRAVEALVRAVGVVGGVRAQRTAALGRAVAARQRRLLVQVAVVGVARRTRGRRGLRQAGRFLMHRSAQVEGALGAFAHRRALVLGEHVVGGLVLGQPLHRRGHRRRGEERSLQATLRREHCDLVLDGGLRAVVLTPEVAVRARELPVLLTVELGWSGGADEASFKSKEKRARLFTARGKFRFDSLYELLLFACKYSCRPCGFRSSRASPVASDTHLKQNKIMAGVRMSLVRALNAIV